MQFIIYNIIDANCMNNLLISQKYFYASLFDVFEHASSYHNYWKLDDNYADFVQDDVKMWSCFPYYTTRVKAIHRSSVIYHYKGPAPRTLNVLIGFSLNNILNNQSSCW